METLPETAPVRRNEDEWLWGWDPTPGIVSIWAEDDGRVTVWRRKPASGELVREGDRFRPWLLLDRLDDLLHLGDALGGGGLDPEADRDDPGGRPRRDRESQSAWIRPSLSPSARAAPRRPPLSRSTPGVGVAPASGAPRNGKR